MLVLPFSLLISQVTASTEWLRGARTHEHSWHPRLIRSHGEQFPDIRKPPGIETPIFLQQCQCANVATAAALEDERAANAVPQALFTKTGATKVQEHHDAPASPPAAVMTPSEAPTAATAEAVVGTPQALTSLTSMDQYPGVGAFAPPPPQFLVPVGYQFLPDYGYTTYGLSYPTLSVPQGLDPQQAALMGPQQLPMGAVAPMGAAPYPAQQLIPSSQAQAPQIPISTQVVDAGGHHSVQINVSAVPQVQAVPPQQASIPYAQPQAIPFQQVQGVPQPGEQIQAAVAPQVQGVPPQQASIPYAQQAGPFQQSGAPPAEVRAQPPPPQTQITPAKEQAITDAGTDETTEQSPPTPTEEQDNAPPPPLENAATPSSGDQSAPDGPNAASAGTGREEAAGGIVPPNTAGLSDTNLNGKSGRSKEPLTRRRKQDDLPNTDSFMRRMLYSMAPRSFFDSPEENPPSRVEVETTRITHHRFAPYPPPAQKRERREERRRQDDSSLRLHARVAGPRAAPFEREDEHMSMRFGQQPIDINMGNRNHSPMWQASPRGEEGNLYSYQTSPRTAYYDRTG